MIFKLVFKAFIAYCIYTAKVKLIVFSEHLCNFPCFYKKQIFEVSENHNSLGMGEYKNQKVKLLLPWHIFKRLSRTHMMGRRQDVQKPKRENFLAGILRTAEKYCLNNSGETICVPDSQRKQTKKESSFSVLFYSSLKSKNTKTVIVYILIHMVSITEVAGLCRTTTK